MSRPRKKPSIINLSDDSVDSDFALQSYLSDSAKDFSSDSVSWYPPSEAMQQAWPMEWWDNEQGVRNREGTTAASTPQLSYSSRSTSTDSLINGLESLNASSELSLTTINSSVPSSPPISSPVESELSDLTPSLSSGSDSEESDPLPLSLPIKIAAFALALLPIRMSSNLCVHLNKIDDRLT